MGKNLKCMKDLELFQALDETERQSIVKLAKGKLYRKGEIIFQEGDTADVVYLIRTGKVLLYKSSVDGKEISLDILEENGIIGENTIFEDLLQTFNARALEDAFICRCFKDDFAKLLQNPAVAMKFIRSLTDKLNSYTDSMADIAFCDVKGRVFNTLIRLGKKYGRNTGEGISLDIQLSHEDIAHMINASRVMVTNSIQALRQEGKIANTNRRFVVLNQPFTQMQSRV